MPNYIIPKTAISHNTKNSAHFREIIRGRVRISIEKVDSYLRRNDNRENQSFVEYFRTFPFIFRIFLNIFEYSWTFSNIFTSFFEYFWMFLNVFERFQIPILTPLCVWCENLRQIFNQKRRGVRAKIHFFKFFLISFHISTYKFWPSENTRIFNQMRNPL